MTGEREKCRRKRTEENKMTVSLCLDEKSKPRKSRRGNIMQIKLLRFSYSFLVLCCQIQAYTCHHLVGLSIWEGIN